MAENQIPGEEVEEQPQAVDNKLNRGKKPKPPKAKKPPKARKPAQEAKAKRRGKKDAPEKSKKPGLVVAIIIIALIAVAGAMYYFNILGIKDKVVGFFISQDTQYKEDIAEANAAEDEYKQKQEELNTRQLELADKEKQLASREQQLNEREATLTEAEQQQASAGGTTSTQVDGTINKSKIVQIYEDMKTDDAITILNSNPDNGWIADLLKQMDEKKAAKILAGLNVEKAIAITNLMSE